MSGPPARRPRAEDRGPSFRPRQPRPESKRAERPFESRPKSSSGRERRHGQSADTVIAKAQPDPSPLTRYEALADAVAPPGPSIKCAVPRTLHWAGRSRRGLRPSRLRVALVRKIGSSFPVRASSAPSRGVRSARSNRALNSVPRASDRNGPYAPAPIAEDQLERVPSTRRAIPRVRAEAKASSRHAIASHLELRAGLHDGTRATIGPRTGKRVSSRLLNNRRSVILRLRRFCAGSPTSPWLARWGWRPKDLLYFLHVQTADPSLRSG